MNHLRTFVAAAALLAAAPARAQDAPRPPAPPASPPPAPPAASPPAEDGARAEDPSAATGRARELKRSGDRAMDALRFAEAHAAYADVYAITRDPALLYNMGRALQALNRFPEALTKLEAFQAVAPPELKAKVPRLAELITDLRGRVATLRVRADVPRGRVLVRSTVMSALPLGEPLRLSAGKAEIEVEADGYFPFHTTVDLPGGGEATVVAKLYSKATTGLLAVRASAPGSTVYVDEVRLGLAPAELNVAGGTHRVRVTNPDFRDYETTAVIAAGSRKDLDVRLLPPLVFTRWWFWGSVVLAGATAGAVAYAATTERPPGRGDIAPGQLPAPNAFRGGVTVVRF